MAVVREVPQHWDEELFLSSLGRFGIQLGLERMTELLYRLGQPQKGIPVIHVAGTNGKGSVCALLSQALWKAGYRVGRYISPHLVSWRERIWVNGTWISTAAWRENLYHLDQVLQSYPAGMEWPTQFDVATAAAWLFFQGQKVDCVVLEVGLGGRLDSTNAGVDTQVAVITSIGWDHWQRLGNSLALIAGEKAGICKAGVPLVTAPQGVEVMAVLQQQAQTLGIPLWVAPPAAEKGPPPHPPAEPNSPRWIEWQQQLYPLALQGQVQLTNAGVALTTLDVLRTQGWRIPVEGVQEGFASTHWPGRLQQMTISGHPLWMDGAHNQPGAEALRQFVDSHWPGHPVTWVMGILDSKDIKGILTALLRPGDAFWALPIPGHQAALTEPLVQMAEQIQPQLSQTGSLAGLPEFVDWMGSLSLQSPLAVPAHPTPQPPTQPTVLCGSLYLIGQVMQECLGVTLAS